MIQQSAADLIRQLLIDTNHGTVAGNWPVYVAYFMDEPHQAICVFDTPGRLDGRLLKTGEQIEHPGVQVQVRGTRYDILWTKVQEIVNYLDSVKNVSVAITSGEAYVIRNVSRSAGALPMGTDEDDGDRHYFAINATLTVERE